MVRGEEDSVYQRLHSQFQSLVGDKDKKAEATVVDIDEINESIDIDELNDELDKLLDLQ